MFFLVIYKVFPFIRRPGRAILIHFLSTTLQVAILRRGALQMGLPPARLETDQKNHFLKKEFTNFGWSLQVAVLRRGALQMGLLPAKPENGHQKHF